MNTVTYLLPTSMGEYSRTMLDLGNLLGWALGYGRVAGLSTCDTINESEKAMGIPDLTKQVRNRAKCKGALCRIVHRIDGSGRHWRSVLTLSKLPGIWIDMIWMWLKACNITMVLSQAVTSSIELIYTVYATYWCQTSREGDHSDRAENESIKIQNPINNGELIDNAISQLYYFTSVNARCPRSQTLHASC